MKHYKVYQYCFPDGMLYIGMTKNSIEVRRDQGYQHNPRLRQALRDAGWQKECVHILNRLPWLRYLMASAGFR